VAAARGWPRRSDALAQEPSAPAEEVLVALAETPWVATPTDDSSAPGGGSVALRFLAAIKASGSNEGSWRHDAFLAAGAAAVAGLKAVGSPAEEGGLAVAAGFGGGAACEVEADEASDNAASCRVPGPGDGGTLLTWVMVGALSSTVSKSAQRCLQIRCWPSQPTPVLLTLVR